MNVFTTKRYVAAIAFCCLAGSGHAQTDSAAKDATAATKEAARNMASGLAWDDDRDFEFVQKGLIARPQSTVIRDASGSVVWNMDRFAYQELDTRAPDTVNPSLWRQTRLNSRYGLFKVTDRIYQVRGYDLSNLSIIEGDTGYIVVDPLLTAEVANAAMELVYAHLPDKPVVAVIYSHSHADHFGGVKGVVDEKDVTAGKAKVIASSGFMDFAVSENVLAGNVMARRASYMFGSLLPKHEKGAVDAGLGKATSSGTITLIEPTDVVTAAREEMIIDGVTFKFMNTPFAEAPAEMMFYLPQMKAFYAAEEANATLHNVYTLRGAQVRDARLWSGYLRNALDLIESDTEVLFGGHHWPRWGHESITGYLAKQADAYKYIHDQTLRLANHGYTMTEIAEMIEFPDSLAKARFNRGYYGSVNHNVKAVYQKYLGWFDGNPANIHPLPNESKSRKYVAYMGGSAAVLEKAGKAFANHEYRWVVEVVNHVVFADPDNAEARALQADALEQLGYQAESAQWRNFYLTGATELRHGVRQAGAPRTARRDLIDALSLGMLFDYLGVKLNGPHAAGRFLDFNFLFTDSGDRYRVTVANGVLNYKSAAPSPNAHATISLTREDLVALAVLDRPAASLIHGGAISVEGDTESFEEMMSLFDDFEFWFDVVTP